MDNVIVDVLSCLPQFDDSITKMELISLDVRVNNNTETISIELDNDTLLQSLLHYPNLPDEIIFPLEYPLFSSCQLQDISLLQQQQHQMNPHKYSSITLDGIDLLCYVTVLGAPWWIDIPEKLLDPIVFWYHKILNHIGMIRLYDTISVHFFQSSLHHGIETIIQSCGVWQRIKLSGAGYGHLTPCEALVVLWFEVTVDPMGPKIMLLIVSRIFTFQA